MTSNSKIRAPYPLRSLRQCPAHEALQKPTRLYKFDDVDASHSGAFVVAQVDHRGHVLSWTRESNKNAGTIDLSFVCDTRLGKYARTPGDFDKVRSVCGDFIRHGEDERECVFTVVSIVGTLINQTFVTFLAPDSATAKFYSENLMRLGAVGTCNRNSLDCLYRHYAKLKYSPTADGVLHVKTIVKSLSLNREDQKRVESAVHNAGLPTGKSDSFIPSRFTENHMFKLYKHLTQRTDVEKIFHELVNQSADRSGLTDRSGILGHLSKSGKTGTLSATAFTDYLNKEQRDPRLNEILYPHYNKDAALELINQNEPDRELASKGSLSLDGFLRFLMSEDNVVLSEEYSDMRPDVLNEPLSHYFISSSHNTYLTGKQIRGRSSVEMYRQVMLTGCRCIELDAWDSQRGDEPMVTHGYALCDWIPFKDILEAIAESAFKISDHPLILSIENHCSPKLQAKMAQYMRTILGDLLLTEALPSHPLESGVPMPSPNLLQRKILVKNKKKFFEDSRNSSIKVHPNSSLMLQSGDSGEIGDGSTGETDSSGRNRLHSSADDAENRSQSSSLDGAAMTVQSNSRSGRTAESGDSGVAMQSNSRSGRNAESDNEDDGTDNEQHSGSAEPGDDDEGREMRAGEEQREAEAVAELSALVNYCQAVKMKGFQTAEKLNRSYEMCSFNETKALDLIKTSGVDFANYNKRQISRIFPKAGRFDSSNFLPHTFWNAGCQMVAVNYQTLDLGMQLNLGFFEQNGRCGYILKPECMRMPDRNFDPFEDTSVENVVANTLSVRVISAQLLDDPSKDGKERKLSTYVLVELYGLLLDTKRSTFKTKRVDNAINPVYESRTFEFNKIVLPELAVLRLAVLEENGKVLGQRFLPVKGLRPGYRHIPLRNLLNQPMGLPTLFVYIKVKDYVPEVHIDFADALCNPIHHVSQMQKREQILRQTADDDDEEQRMQKGRSQSTRTTDEPPISPSSKTETEESSAITPVATAPSLLSANNASDLPHPQSAVDIAQPSTSLASLPSKLSTPELSKEDNLRLLATPTARGSMMQSRAQPVFELDNSKYDAPIVDLIFEDKRLKTLTKKHEKEIDQLRRKYQQEPRDAARSGSGKRIRIKLPGFVAGKRGSESRKESANGSVVNAEADEALSAQFHDQEYQLRRQHLDALKECTDGVVAQFHERTIKDLSHACEKEKTETIKRYQDDRKQRVVELSKDVRDKEDFSRQRKELEEDTIKLSVDAGRRIKQLEENQRAEVDKTYGELRQQLDSKYKQDLATLENNFRHIGNA